jgi:hypothetical protein
MVVTEAVLLYPYMVVKSELALYPQGFHPHDLVTYQKPCLPSHWGLGVRISTYEFENKS